MKKLLGIALAISLLLLSSCGNQRLWDFEYDVYNYIHDVHNGRCYKIKSWKNNEIGIKVDTEDYGFLYFSEGTYILVEDKCPICGDHK